MLALDAAIERLEKKANEPKAVMFGLSDDLRVMACALREIRKELTKETPEQRALREFIGERTAGTSDEKTKAG